MRNSDRLQNIATILEKLTCFKHEHTYQLLQD